MVKRGTRLEAKMPVLSLAAKLTYMILNLVLTSHMARTKAKHMACSIRSLRLDGKGLK